MNRDNILEMTGVTKTFPGVKALDHMNLTVRKGTVHALMGENGAGKSTLMKILIGLYTYDEGKIVLNGTELKNTNIKTMMDGGISMIHQELNTLDYLTVAENIFVNREPHVGKSFIVDFKKMRRDSEEILKSLGLEMDVNARVGRLSVAQRQLLEIVKAVSFNAKLIIMDEPTSAITEKECAQLFEIIRRLREEGIAFIYITHKMDEVFKIADDITVMRDGQYIATLRAPETNHDELVKLMVGREITDIYPKETIPLGDTTLKVENLCVDGLLNNISFEAKRGEILGVAGLMGAGRTEIMETIYGMRKATSGSVYLNGKKLKIRKPKDAIRNGIAFLTEDRKKNGCFLPLTVYYNTMMLTWKKKFGIVSERLSRKSCNEQIEKYGVRTPSIKQYMNKLSGGNQQKVLLARWLASAPEIIILDEPTRGIDVGSKHEIYNEMTRLVKEGKTIIMISSEMPEILGMSDRIMVVHDGELTGILGRSEASQETVLSYAAGLLNNIKKG